MKIYTRKGDDGTTGLLFGGRVAKDSELPTAYGTVDEAQAVLGVARARAPRPGELDDLLVAIERDLWILMAELATHPRNRHKLTPGQNRVTAEMVTGLEQLIDDLSDRFDPPTEFVVPGETEVAAYLDLARTVVRRAERDAIRAFAGPIVAAVEPDELDEPSELGDPSDHLDTDASHVIAYLNRLSDLLWTMARWQEGHSRLSREA